MRLAIIAIVLVVLAGLGALFFGEQLGISGLGSTSNATEVRVEVAEEGDLVESVSAPGWIEPVLQVALSAEVSAKVIEVLIDEGDAVTEGQLLVRLEDRELQADLKAAQARREGTQYGLNREETGLEARRRDLEFSQREVERVRALFESGDVSERELEQAESNFANAKTAVDTALIAVSSAETNLVSADADLGRLEALILGTLFILASSDYIIECSSNPIGWLCINYINLTYENPSIIDIHGKAISQPVRSGGLNPSGAGLLPQRRNTVSLCIFPTYSNIRISPSAVSIFFYSNT